MVGEPLPPQLNLGNNVSHFMTMEKVLVDEYGVEELLKDKNSQITRDKPKTHKSSNLFLADFDDFLKKS